MPIRGWIITTVLSGLFLGTAGGVAAQTVRTLQWVEVAIWPEYDRPSALIILSAGLPDGAPLPATVSLPLPTGTTPHAVAKRTPDGRLLMADYSREEGEAGSQVRITTDVREVRLEYYTDLSILDATRELIWVWPGGVDVGTLAYDVMWPLGATRLTVDPPPGARRTDSAGLTYLSADLGPKSFAERLALRLTYDKPTPQLTVAALQAARAPTPPQAPPEPAPAEPPAPTPAAPAPPPRSSIWLFALPLLALGLIVAWTTLRRRRR